MNIELQISRRDADYAINLGYNNEKNIQITKEVCIFLLGEFPKDGHNVVPASFYIFKEDFLKSACGITSSLPLLDKFGHAVSFSCDACDKMFKAIDAFFGNKTIKQYKVKLYYDTYLNEYFLQDFDDLFSIRSFLVEAWSKLVFCEKKDERYMHLVFSKTLSNPLSHKKSKNLECTSLFPFTNLSPRQIIYYGAPGTGKSHTIKKEEDEGLICIRTTFHPDSDYSTFVGCYKPHKCKESGALTYEFVEQAFLEAYKQAWLTPDKEIALVIEEINRGNCAQVFGDIFQLLDRDKDGWSTYPIKADTDICDYLKGLAIPSYQETLRERYGKDKEGNYKDETRDWYGYMALPPNMSILATMNTSDQSLFPIDSAFKRRWDWKYVKIKPGKDKQGNKLDWHILVKDEAGNVVKVGDEAQISWWTFIQKINEIIASMTSSADKQLGYFFCKPTEKAKETDELPSIINADTLVGKVIFYLWNDVFKDYGFEDAYLFSYLEKVEGKDVEKDLTFADFYDEEGEHVDTQRLADFLEKVMTWQKNKEDKE